MFERLASFQKLIYAGMLSSLPNDLLVREVPELTYEAIGKRVEIHLEFTLCGDLLVLTYQVGI